MCTLYQNKRMCHQYSFAYCTLALQHAHIAMFSEALSCPVLPCVGALACLSSLQVSCLTCITSVTSTDTCIQCCLLPKHHTSQVLPQLLLFTLHLPPALPCARFALPSRALCAVCYSHCGCFLVIAAACKFQNLLNRMVSGLCVPTWSE